MITGTEGAATALGMLADALGVEKLAAFEAESPPFDLPEGG